MEKIPGNKEAEKDTYSYLLVFVIIFLCFFTFLYVSSALGIPPYKVVPPHSPFAFPRFPARSRSFFLPLGKVILLSNFITLFVPVVHSRLVSKLRLSLRKKAPLAVIAGIMIFLPFFIIPPIYRFFAIGMFLLPSAIGLSGFYSSLGEKISRLFKLESLSEFLFVVLGMFPFFILSLLIEPFYLRVLFNFLMIYGLGTLISLVI